MNCTDKRCPVHGELPTRGRTFEGKVVSVGMAKSVIVEITRLEKDEKYHRFQRSSMRIAAHLPECMKVKNGNFVKIAECRKLSKTKDFVVIEVKQ